MSQAEVLELLVHLRLSGDESFYTTREILRLLEERGVKLSNRSVLENLTRLLLRGVLEMRPGVGLGGWKGRKYRVSREYLRVIGLNNTIK